MVQNPPFRQAAATAMPHPSVAQDRRHGPKHTRRVGVVEHEHVACGVEVDLQTVDIYDSSVRAEAGSCKVEGTARAMLLTTALRGWR